MDESLTDAASYLRAALEKFEVEEFDSYSSGMFHESPANAYNMTISETILRLIEITSELKEKYSS